MSDVKTKDAGPGFWLGLIGFMGRNSLAFAGGVLFAYYSHNTIQKIDYNLFEGKTTVKQGYFQNPQELQIFFDKKNGEIIPSYGTIDKKIAIGSDLAPYGFMMSVEDVKRMKMDYQTKLSQLDDKEKRFNEGFGSMYNKVDSLLGVRDSLILGTLKQYGGK